MASLILIRFGELTLKGHNRSRFEDAVVADIAARLRAFPNIQLESFYGRLIVVLNGEPFIEISAKLDTVFGIHSYSPAERCDLEPESIRETALLVMRQLVQPPKTFKVAVRRTNKQFPLNSMQMNDYVGGYILANTPGLKVEVRHPEIELQVEIRETYAYICCEIYPGLGGYPKATSGKAMLLLSGGIDSPVAGFLALKRGLELEAVHFHSYPFTSERAQQKVRELASQLSVYSSKITLHMVPFTDIQTRLKQTDNDKLLITLIRRAMLRVTERLAISRQAKAIITGESLGQVASQTLPGLTVIGQAATEVPVLRPLIMLDKSEIIQMARKIGTYPISIQPYEDCCTLFVPKSPSTNPNPHVITKIEEKAVWLEAAITEAVLASEVSIIEENKMNHSLSLYF